MFVESLDEVPPGSPLLYSAHGVSPQIREQARRRRLIAIDATCPLVIKVHLEAVRYAVEGYTIFLIGHEGHDEVIGTMGEAPNQMILVETAEDVERLVVPDPNKVAYLTQTTLSVDDANIVIAALRKKVSQDRQSPQGRHLLRNSEPSGSRARTGRTGRFGAGTGEPEQLQQPSARRDRPWARDPVPFDRRCVRDSAFLVHRRRNGPDHRRGQRARASRPGVHRVPRDQLRRDHPGRDGPQGERPFPASEVAAAVAVRRNRAVRLSTTSTGPRRPSRPTLRPAGFEQIRASTAMAGRPRQRQSRPNAVRVGVNTAGVPGRDSQPLLRTVAANRIESEAGRFPGLRGRSLRAPSCSGAPPRRPAPSPGSA